MEVIHKMIDCENPPPDEELTPEQLGALRMWGEDTKRMKEETDQESLSRLDVEVQK